MLAGRDLVAVDARTDRRVARRRAHAGRRRHAGGGLAAVGGGPGGLVRRPRRRAGRRACWPTCAPSRRSARRGRVMRILVLQHVASAPLAAYAEVLADRGVEIDAGRLEAGDAIPASLAGRRRRHLAGRPDEPPRPGRPRLARARARPDPPRRRRRRAVLRRLPRRAAARARVRRPRPRRRRARGRAGAGAAARRGRAATRCSAASARPIPAFHWHADTFELPAAATLLASSERYPQPGDPDRRAPATASSSMPSRASPPSAA